MDERGKGKVKKSDFISSVERMRISLTREDITKIWNYIDSKQQGYIQLSELSVAYANRLNNFNNKVEMAVENRAVQQYKLQATTDKEVEQINTPVNQGKGSPGRVMQNTGGRSPLIRKSLEHVYGCKNMYSDNIGNVVGNTYMQEAAV